jgi:hypothetical protein
VTAFLADLAAWTVVEITPAVVSRSRRLLLVHDLRAGDALQLGSALALQEAIDLPLLTFVAFDARLIVAASAEGLSVAPISV